MSATPSQPNAVRYPLQRLDLAALEWGPADGKPLIALHGWLDNAASFNVLAPLLLSGRRVIAIDLPGHGYSDHRSADTHYLMVEAVQELADLVRRYFEPPIDLLGHSLGGIIASLYAASFPEQVGRLAMIDSLGPYVADEKEFARRLRKGFGRALEGARSSLPVYATREEAYATRIEGGLPLSPKAAEAIVTRNLRECEGGWTWRTDRRLRWPSPVMLTEGQVRGYLSAIECPVLLALGEDGMMAQNERIRARSECIANLQTVTVAGGHHCHLDGDVDTLGKHLRHFYQDD
ncbi:alpha/beta hydrolase [Marinobacteraceae bacterium S3BR75-40.1]